MDETNGLIYGLELQARALCPQYAEGNEARFFIATNSLKPTNQLHLVEYSEENSKLQSKIFEHALGEVWKVTSSHQNARLLATCYNTVQGAQVMTKGALFTLPESLEDEEEITCEFLPWGNVNVLETEKFGEKVKTLEFHPGREHTLGMVVDGKVIIYNISGEKARVASEMSVIGSQNKGTFTTGKWSHHYQGNQFIVLHESSVRSYDIRDGLHYAWSIEDAHGQLVRDLDCNPNKQCHIVTGGDDGYVKVWDCRMPKEPVYSRNDHAHWVWCVRFNTFHDQLILSSSSDNKVLLTCAGSVSSEAETQTANDIQLDNLKNNNNNNNNNNSNNDSNNDSKKINDDDINTTLSEKCEHLLPDGLLQTFDQHEDSVYCVEWSNVDPWVFASLSYDGRLLISKVPKQYKYQIIAI